MDRCKQGFATDNIDVQARLFAVPELIIKWALSCAILGYLILQLVEFGEPRLGGLYVSLADG